MIVFNLVFLYSLILQLLFGGNMFRNFWAVLLVILTAWASLGCESCSSTNYFTYTKSNFKEHVSIVKNISIWMDSTFTDNEIIEVKKAIDEWNLALNNRIVLKVAGSFDKDFFDIKYEEVEKTGLDWVFVRFEEEELIGKNMIEPKDGTLAFTSRIGGDILVIISDRIGSRNLKIITMHEIGHMLGARHVSTASLMYPNYGNMAYDCIDKITIAQVAGYQKIDIRAFNYCITPNFE
jgi:predicted Zn-dependent protease